MIIIKIIIFLRSDLKLEGGEAVTFKSLFLELLTSTMGLLTIDVGGSIGTEEEKPKYIINKSELMKV